MDSLPDIPGDRRAWIRAPQDDRFEFVIQVAAGMMPDLEKIAERLSAWSYPEG
ncbi:hypothetical protein H7H78_02545 [Mycobacterium shinjukuense]|uniref:Uncharacterized protein n=1 Tax=Mycobacterium shinjukuense TaxID=398694 RepID=A0A7I7MP64_9MYCO|nr:hypothetical protein [Mycobacterium shinjukuense]BBX73089.1 hypothetical protein MSHI_09950 [Mycobacterium shinjukuense]